MELGWYGMNDFLPQFIQQLFNGLSLGAIYALVAIGYTMVYGIIGMINFAHGEIYMIAAYIGLVTLSAIGTQSGLPVFVVIGAMLLVAVVLTGVYGYVVEQVAYKPLRSSPRLVALISAIGMSIFLQNWVALGQGARDMAVPSLLPGAFNFHMGDFEVFVPYTRILIIVVGVGNPEINAIAGPAVEGMLVTLPADFASNPKNAAIVKAFKDKKRDPSGSFQMGSYTAVQVIADSIKAVGNDGAKVAKHLHTATFETPLGKLAWDAKGDLKSYDFQVFSWHKDGSKSPATK